MTYPNWPAELPQRVMVDGFSQSIDDTRAFTEMDAGPPKVRSRGIQVESISCQMIIDAGQFARFKRFWKEEVGKGVLPFLIPDQVLDGLPVLDQDGLPVLNDAGDPVLGTYNWLATFGREAPQISSRSRTWFALSFTLLVQPA